MKKLFFVLLSLFVASCTFSQEVDTTGTFIYDDIKDSKVKPDKNDRMAIDLYNDIWQGTPDTMDLRTINPGINIYLMQDIPLDKDHFSLAFGLGIGVHNIHSNSYPDPDELHNISGKDSTGFCLIPDSIDYKKNKLAVTYADLPLEFRFKSGKFRFSVGFKAGMLLDTHTKYSGDDLSDNDKKVRMKEHGIENILRYRYGATVRIGYDWINLFGYYSLSNLFEENKGPEMYPVSVGVSLTF